MWRKRLFGSVLFLVLVATVVASISFSLGEGKELSDESGEHSIPFITHKQIMNPEEDRKYNIAGYLEVTSDKEELKIKRGETANVTFYLHFVSYDPEVEDLNVRLDPEGEGINIKQKYVVLDSDGNVIDREVINVNELMRYEPSGLVTIENGQTLPIVASISVPELPGRIHPESFPISSVGISPETTKVPVIGNAKVDITLSEVS